MSDPTPRNYLWPTAEQELVLRAAIGSDTESVAAFRQWNDSTDYQDHFDFGVFRLLPLIYRRMSACGVEAQSMPKLKGVYRHAWCDTQRLLHRVREVVRRLRASGMEVVLLKGAPLLTGYYGQPGVRPMSDVDIVVRARDFRRALGVVGDTPGWVLPASCARLGLDPSLEIEPDDLDIDFHHSVAVAQRDGGEIDVHCYFFRDACNASANEWFWRRTVAYDFLGVGALQLDPTAMLTHVIGHGVRPNPAAPVRWIADAHMILARAAAEIRWDDIVNFAREQKLSHRLGLGLTYIHDRFHAPVPAEVVARLRAVPLSPAERIENRFLLDVERRPSFLGRALLAVATGARRSRDKGPYAFWKSLAWRVWLRGCGRVRHWLHVATRAPG